MNTLAVITARQGSVGLPDKNIRPLHGKPVIAWTIEAALNSRRLDRVVVSTDDQRIQPICAQYGITFIPRPDQLATGTARIDSVLRHAVHYLTEHENLTPDTVVLLYANVPVRAPDIIDRVIDKLHTTRADSVQSMSAVGKNHPFWLYRIDNDHAEKYIPNTVHRRQDLPPVFALDGAASAVTFSSLLAAENNPDPHAFWGTDRRAVTQPLGSTVDIDALIDFYTAQAVLRDREQKTASDIRTLDTSSPPDPKQHFSTKHAS